jgi:hypothetical protein
MLDAIPDMREALNEADEDELIELFVPSTSARPTASQRAGWSLPPA